MEEGRSPGAPSGCRLVDCVGGVELERIELQLGGEMLIVFRSTGRVT